MGQAGPYLRIAGTSTVCADPQSDLSPPTLRTCLETVTWLRTPWAAHKVDRWQADESFSLQPYRLDWSCPWVTFPNILHIVGSFWVKSGTTMVWGGGRGFALVRC